MVESVVGPFYFPFVLGVLIHCPAHSLKFVKRFARYSASPLHRVVVNLSWPYVAAKRVQFCSPGFARIDPAA